MSVDDITIDDFKAYFVRDFTYGETVDTVLDSDITRAFGEAKINFNQNLFDTDDSLKIAYLYLTAHYMTTYLQTAQQGVNSVGYNPVSSRSVGAVSESYEIPEWMLKDIALSSYTTTRYGQKYLSIIRPLLIGNVGIAYGWTLP